MPPRHKALYINPPSYEPEVMACDKEATGDSHFGGIRDAFYDTWNLHVQQLRNAACSTASLSLYTSVYYLCFLIMALLFESGKTIAFGLAGPVKFDHRCWRRRGTDMCISRFEESSHRSVAPAAQSVVHHPSILWTRSHGLRQRSDRRRALGRNKRCMILRKC